MSVYSRPDGAGEDEPAPVTCHARGRLAADSEPAPAGPVEWPPAGAESVAADSLYALLADIGFDYGPAFQNVRAAWRVGEEVYADVALSDDLPGTGFGIHPALFDAALHGGMLDVRPGDPVGLPFAWSGVRLGRTGATRARVRIGPAGESAVRLSVTGETGEPVVDVAKLSVRTVDPAQLGRSQETTQRSLFQLDWTAVPVPEPREVQLAVLGDVAAAGQRFADLTELEEEVAMGTPMPDLVLASIDTPAGADAGAARTAATAALDLVQRWLVSEWLVDARLVVVTRGAVAVGEETSDLAQAAVWGLVHSAQSEHPGRFLLVDVDGSAEPAWGSVAELDEPQLALREGRLVAPRLGRLAALPSGAWRLSVGRKGSLEDLTLVGSDGDRPLGAGEVRIGVRAAGLNFRDVLIALGMYPGEAEMGTEAAGVVLEVGADVTDLAPGDRVFGLVADSFGPVAVSDRRMLAPMPAGWSFAQAASVPVVYLTAYYGLVELAGLRAGERVLVHTAAGGVGMAAVQLARHLGAEVFATASPPKWEVVRGLGVAAGNLASSRDLEFRETFLAATDGDGVDVVLNALAGDFVDASLALLPRGGRFVEMGKADVRDPEVVGREHAGVTYRSFDLMESGPDRLQAMLRRAARPVRAGRAPALPGPDLGRAAEPGRVPVPAGGPQRRQGGADRAGGAGPGRHRADHRRHRRAGRAAGPAPGRAARRAAAAAGQPPRPGRRRGDRAGRRPGGARRRGPGRGLRRGRPGPGGAAAGLGRAAAHRGRARGRRAGRRRGRVADPGAGGPGDAVRRSTRPGTCTS